MKTFLNTFGYMLIILGIVSAAGAAGDCDGKCMELANPIWLMALIAFGSLVSIVLGGIFLIQANNFKGGR
jgi:hypothetical protein